MYLLELLQQNEMKLQTNIFLSFIKSLKGHNNYYHIYYIIHIVEL